MSPLSTSTQKASCVVVRYVHDAFSARVTDMATHTLVRMCGLPLSQSPYVTSRRRYSVGPLSRIAAVNASPASISVAVRTVAAALSHLGLLFEFRSAGAGE